MIYYLFKKVHNIYLMSINYKNNYYKRHKNKLLFNTVENYKLI